LNVSFQQVYFEPHQCGSECLKEFPYTEGDFKSKEFSTSSNS
jgi:hypothetical protein